MNPALRLVLLGSFGLVACGTEGEDPTDTGSTATQDGGDGTDGTDAADGREPLDADGDGYTEDEDCDDRDPTTNPGADEDCSDTDRNCDGDPTAGAVDRSVGYADEDGDGYGNPERPIDGCEPGVAVVDDASDCDDGDRDINPGAEERCDGGVDEDCDGAVDAEDPDLGACDPSDWNGTYTGTFDLTVSASGINDSCSGSGVVEVEAGARPELAVSVNCTFGGVLTTFFPDTYTIASAGSFEGVSTASGDVSVSGLDVTDVWSGTFTAPGSFSLSFSGSATIGGISGTYSGLLIASR